MSNKCDFHIPSSPPFYMLLSTTTGDAKTLLERQILFKRLSPTSRSSSDDRLATDSSRISCEPLSVSPLIGKCKRLFQSLFGIIFTILFFFIGNHRIGNTSTTFSSSKSSASKFSRSHIDKTIYLQRLLMTLLLSCLITGLPVSASMSYNQVGDYDGQNDIHYPTQPRTHSRSRQVQLPLHDLGFPKGHTRRQQQRSPRPHLDDYQSDQSAQPGWNSQQQTVGLDKTRLPYAQDYPPMDDSTLHYSDYNPNLDRQLNKQYAYSQPSQYNTYHSPQQQHPQNVDDHNNKDQFSPNSYDQFSAPYATQHRYRFNQNRPNDPVGVYTNYQPTGYGDQTPYYYNQRPQPGQPAYNRRGQFLPQGNRRRPQGNGNYGWSPNAGSIYRPHQRGHGDPSSNYRALTDRELEVRMLEYEKERRRKMEERLASNNPELSSEDHGLVITGSKEHSEMSQKFIHLAKIQTQRGLKKFFDDIDLDKDGSIKLEEIQNYLILHEIIDKH